MALNASQQKDVTADCVNMTREVIDKATKNEQMERREDYFVDGELEIYSTSRL